MTTAILKEITDTQKLARSQARLLVEVTAEAAATVLAVGVGVGAVVALLVLDEILGNAAHDGATDCSQNTVVGLVASETTG